MSSASSSTQWLVILTPPRETFPADATDDEMAIVMRHAQHLTKLRDASKLLLAGRTTEDSNPIGLAIFEECERAEVEAMMQDDPVIESGLFSMEIRPYEIAMMRGGA